MTDDGSEAPDYLAYSFQFDPETASKLLELTPPCREWLEEFKPVIEAIGSVEELVAISLEGAANRFLRGMIQPVSKVRQRTMLKSIEHHAASLAAALMDPNVRGSPIADPFTLVRHHAKGVKPEDFPDHYETDAFRLLKFLEVFARQRLASEADAESMRIEKIKRRKEYPRFVLIADLLAAHRRITGQIPTAYATEDRAGTRRRSEGVAFLSVALPPILKAARLASTDVDDQILKLEVAKVKALWEEGRNPELAYTFPAWGSMVRDGG